jgi:hypothetical protein
VLDALGYLVSAIDARQMARMKGKSGTGDPVAEEGAKEKKPEKKWLSYRNEALWTQIF